MHERVSPTQMNRAMAALGAEKIKGSGVFHISVYLPNGDFKSELDLKSEPGPVTA